MAHMENCHLLNDVPGTNMPIVRPVAPCTAEIQPMGCFQARQQLLLSSSSCNTAATSHHAGVSCFCVKQLLLKASWENGGHLGCGAAGQGSQLYFRMKY